ncbi:MarR family transcriptional regulator [Streptomyces sp. QL37]|uniref:MarR family transcriptional regulator n=1 Tax=Streptomyces sp. QL37 TaxID=2093747 RepID=UPI000CF2531F|nr:MarR family transcriptional regulator [Streptomyces sp. QL37]PPQ59329.1 MarR family transcriptional regulator [Streptomyces sp. QL37]
MAIQHSNSAVRAPAPPSRPYAKANPGYGKRSTPDQRPPRPDDFALLPERERYVAGYVDHLPDGAAMDIKSLAKSLPLYGQMAVGSALKALAVAGHLRHVRCPADAGGGQIRWITRTYWSRTARDNEWWATFLGGAPAAPAVPQQRTQEPEPVLITEEAPQEPPPETPADVPSPAYLALARLGRADARLALSAADCAALEEAAAAWLVRGVDAEYLVRTLTAGLPAAVESPVGLVRRRLRDKLPPLLPAAAPAPATGVPGHHPMVECAECGAPGRPEALPDGLCRSCRTPGPTGTDATAAPAPPDERDVAAYVGTLRDLLRLP